MNSGRQRVSGLSLGGLRQPGQYVLVSQALLKQIHDPSDAMHFHISSLAQLNGRRQSGAFNRNLLNSMQGF